ncbi:hypothetical protein AJ80_04093 [Polytolypa hystricis UAMH7299]|uniref:M-phase inducer phosphatase n=1 Tax=Polytolypa hystricis (strain UAMH7299) TaxID=1447883 RepID=A0A2B7YE93_POLH7|nr:hypothetical protein AJ80_04093 [Polytolypa hystricis UAMH7299]
MEHSSPLAAMQPPSLLFGHCMRAESSTSFRSFPAVRNFGPHSFNFKDLAMKKASNDYFNVKPVGSSPTASLAADLSQNFHIDQSPQLVTPRRSLFSANLFGPEIGRDIMTTPPLPSSSPAHNIDMMDMSPLPHKIPYFQTTDMDLESPTADLSFSKSALQIPSPLQESPIEDSKSADNPEGKRPPFLRPSLMRAKAQGSFPKNSQYSQAPPFKFGNGASKLSSTSMTLSEIFVESPPHERPVPKANSTNNLMGPPRPRAPFSSAVGQSRSYGSPSNGHVRKNSNPFCRPRKLSRRSLSMFEHPEDVIKQQEDSESPLQSISDMDSPPALHLPHFMHDGQQDGFPRIESQVLVDVINGKFNDKYDNVVIIDCRFKYEYDGGHINGALNYEDKETLAGELFQQERKPNTVLVFHCEYSEHRAPIMAKFIRHKDRAINIDVYPALTYPEMYILDGGYRAFFPDHRSLCFPQNYVEMTAKEHEFACERGLGKVKQRNKLSRAQTFAFGDNQSQMEDSPTGRCRNNAGERNSCLDLPFERTGEPGRLPGRRMLSY